MSSFSGVLSKADTVTLKEGGGAVEVIAVRVGGRGVCVEVEGGGGVPQGGKVGKETFPIWPTKRRGFPPSIRAPHSPFHKERGATYIGPLWPNISFHHLAF